jgi:hypothetical protein
MPEIEVAIGHLMNILLAIYPIPGATAIFQDRQGHLAGRGNLHLAFEQFLLRQ